MPWSGKHGLITRVYLRQFGTVERAVQFALFVSMVLHATYPQTGFPAVLQPLPLALTVKLWLNNTFLRTHAPFRSFAFLLDLGIELIENQCQSVCFAGAVARQVVRLRAAGRPRCDALSRGSDFLRRRMLRSSSALEKGGH